MLYQAETILNVEFYDLDPMNVVWHGNYVKYLAAARCDMQNKLGYNYMDMKDDGVCYPIATVDMKYIKPCVFNQQLRVVSSIEEIEPCLIIKYTIFEHATIASNVIWFFNEYISVVIYCRYNETSCNKRSGK